jgi:hypothetical protein
MRMHLTILAVLYFLTSVGELLVALTAFGVTAGVGVVAEGPAALLVPLLGSMVGVFFLVLAVPGLALGYGFLKARPWAWILGLILGVLNLFNVPVGTLLGIYTLYVLTRAETKALLGVGTSGI